MFASRKKQGRLKFDHIILMGTKAKHFLKSGLVLDISEITLVWSSK